MGCGRPISAGGNAGTGQDGAVTPLDILSAFVYTVRSMKITLYTTHCPKCKVIEEKLKKSDLEYTVCENMDEFMAKYPGIETVPQLEVTKPDGTVELLGFSEANFFVNSHILHRMNG
jgi:hypothetical protein